MAISLSSRRAVLRRFAALGCAPPRFATRLNSTQGFVMYNATNSAPHLPSAYRVDSLRTLSLRSTAQLNDLFFTSRRSKAQRSATLHAFRQRSSPQFNSTICFLPRYLTRRSAAPLDSAQRNDLFVTTPLHAARLFTVQHGSLPLTAPQLNSTICLLLRDATWLIASLRSSTQLNELKLN